jgi:hypothetical protein
MQLSAPAVASPFPGGLPGLPSAYIPPELLTWGSVAVPGDPVLVAGQRASLEIEAILAQPLPSGHGVELWTHFVSDIERPQCADPDGPAFVACETSGPAAGPAVGPAAETFDCADASVHGPHTFFPYRRYAGVRLLEDAPVGTRFVLRLRNVRMQTYEEPLFNLRLAILRDGHTLAGYLGDACYAVRGGPAHRLRLVAPTCVDTGRPFDLSIVVCDRFGNKTGDPLDGLAFDLAAEDGAGGAAHLAIAGVRYDAARRLHVVHDVRCETPGTYYVRAGIRAAAHVAGTSNPIVVRERWTERVYWGDLHQHSYHDDGRGLPASNYAYARDTSRLDFCAVTPHQECAIAPALHRLPGAPVQRGWEELVAAAEAANGPDLVTFLGSEASALGPLAGHMNAFYLDVRNRPEFERLGWDPAAAERPEIGSYARYLAVLEASHGEVLLLPHAHAGGSPGKFPLPKRPEYQTGVEICSVHGVFEEFHRQWLRHGHRVGVHGGGDNHMTSTGAANPGWHYPNTNGLAAVSATEKTRPAIWQGIRGRRTYAVTANQRIFLAVTVDGHPMGSAISHPSDAAGAAGAAGNLGAADAAIGVRSAGTPGRAGSADPHRIRVEVAGTAPLLRVELFRGDDVIRSYHPPLPAGQRRYLRVVWTDSFGQRRVDDSTTTGRIALDGGRLRLCAALNAYTYTDSFEEDNSAVRVRASGYSGITRGMIVEALPSATPNTSAAPATPATSDADAPASPAARPAATLPAAGAALSLRFEIADRQLAETLLEGTFSIPLAADHARVTRPLAVDPSLSRWRNFSPEPQLPEFVLDVDWIDPAWPRCVTLEWEDAPAADAYYYARVEQIDGALAWSSPIWLSPPS